MPEGPKNMDTRPKGSVRFAIAAAIAIGYLKAQAVAATPQQPKWGESMQVTYDPSSPEAQLRLSDPVWAATTIYFEDLSVRKMAGAMTISPDHRLQYEATVPPGACLIEIAFVTPHDYDSKTTATAVVLRPNGQPARGAYDHLMWKHAADAERYFQQEIALYPDNFAAYRHRWFLSDGGKEKEIATIRADLEKIGTPPPNPSAEWFYAMAYAWWRLGDAGQAETALRRLVETFPDSPLTDDALNYYLFRSTGEVKRQAQQWERDLVAGHPASAHAGFAITALAADRDFPFDAVQNVAREQLKVEPDNPGPYLAIAHASLAHRRDYPQALAGLRKAISLLLEGKYRIWSDPAGTLTQHRLEEAYRLCAEIDLAQGAFPDALADVKAAESFERDNDPAGHLLEARIWSALSDWRRAEAVLVEAWRRDPVASEGELHQVFERIRGNSEGFRSFLDANRTAAKTAQEQKRSFPFDAVSLTGERWSLEGLKGKVVALNFWFVGCLPCRQEIPALNRLVERYKDVVFLGFALDDEDQLRDFLKKFPFHYQIVPNAQKVADGFRVAAYPAHILINPAGEIAFQANQDDVEALRTALARLTQAAGQ
jgi:thiol-disulfide isomerase/thioredoxin